MDRPDGDGRSLELQIERMQARVDEAADRLLREGGELTVRSVRARTGGNPNVVAPAFRRWRQNLALRLDGKSQAPDLPPQVLQFVRLGYQAAQTIAEQRRLSLLPPDKQLVAERDALRTALAGARGEVEALRDERAALFEKNGMLTGELAAHKTMREQLAQDRADMQRRLDEAATRIGALTAQIAETTKAAARRPKRPQRRLSKSPTATVKPPTRAQRKAKAKPTKKRTLRRGRARSRRR